jgi:hypothetical protein
MRVPVPIFAARVAASVAMTAFVAMIVPQMQPLAEDCQRAVSGQR